MIEDINAQLHLLADTLTFQEGTVALSALRALGGGQNYGGSFTQLLGLSFEDFGDGRCVAALDVSQHLLNPHGIAHGGVAFSLADSASGGAALSVLDKPRLVTQDMQIRYHGPARPGRLQAAAEVIHHGKRTITVQCRLTQGEILVASTTATFAILSDEELAELQRKKAGE